MEAVTLIFPHQLFQSHPALQAGRPVYLIEEFLFFQQYNFHQKKLLLHRASMTYYADWLRKKGYAVKLLEAAGGGTDVATVIAGLPEEVKELHVAELTDDWLQRRLQKAAGKKELAVIVYTTPQFLNTQKHNNDYFDNGRRYFQTEFYIHQRQRLGLLLEGGQKPLGGKWTYDSDNRDKFPKGQRPPGVTLPDNRTFVPGAKAYVQQHFGKNYGNTEPPFFQRAGFYPVTHAEAEAWLEEFLSVRFLLFGRFEDAMVPGEGLLYHSCLAALLNTGLLTPKQVLEKALDAAVEYQVPLNSIEGFVRQLVGWREFIRAVYEREGRRQRTTNFWGFARKIPGSFWTGTTGLAPLDSVVQRVVQNGYAHHIERLMVMGNFFLLCEFNPGEVYRWFMELFIDAYDWVMVPNTYGMVSFADGGLMMTKPYISGSNYLLKMGTWEKGPWQQTWDGLFWRFLHVHRNFFFGNPRLGMLVRSFDKMPADKRKSHLTAAEKFLQSLDK